MNLPVALFQEITGCADVRGDGSCGRGKRRAGRIPVSLDTHICRIRQGVRQTPVVAKIKEMSIRGIGLIYIEPMQVGEEFLVRLPRKSGAPLWVHCTVARWQPIGPRFSVIGASFNCVVDLKYAAGRESSVEPVETAGEMPCEGVPEVSDIVARIREAMFS